MKFSSRFPFVPGTFLILPLALLALNGCGRGHTKIKAPPPPPPVIGLSAEGGFLDVSKAAGITYQWSIPGSRPLNILQTVGNGCAFIDYDNDGNLDILFIGVKIALYRGDGQGHFTDVTHDLGLDKLSGHFLGCAVGDYDNDGFEDVYIGGYRAGCMLHNEHGKSFKDVTTQLGLKPQRWATSCAFADVNNDGLLDLYIGNYAKFGSGSQQLCNNNGYPTACGPRFYDPERGTLYLQKPGGRFQEATSQWDAQKIAGKTLGVAFVDFDGSGRQSLALGNDEVAGDLLQNDGSKFKNVGITSGTAFDPHGLAHGGMGVDWADYDNDGKPDLVVATFAHENKCIYHNIGEGMFDDLSVSLGIVEKTSPYVAFGVKWMDYDNDGWQDLMFANGHVQDNIALIDKGSIYKEPTQLFHNLHGKKLEDMSATGGPDLQRKIVGRGLVTGDFDNDGRIDVLVVDEEGAPLLLHNEFKNTGHWLSIALTGKKSNRDGLGAIVQIATGDLKQTLYCQTGGSYLSASDRRLHAGLGTATAADSITVHWPGGHVDTFKNVKADQRIVLTEGGNAPTPQPGAH